MSSADTDTLGHQFFASQDRLKGGPDPALCAPGYTAHLAGFPTFDLDGHHQFATAFYAGFPDFHHTIEDTVANGDRIAVRWTGRGTHTGNFFGIPASQKPIEVRASIMMRLSDGKVAELHGIFDQLGLLRQIGALPPG